MNDTAPINKSNHLAESALGGFDLVNPDMVHVQAVIRSFVVKAKDDSLTVNPAVLFIKTCKVLKDQANVARLPDEFAEELRSICAEQAHVELRKLQSEGYQLSRIGATKTQVNLRNLSVETVKSAKLVKANHSAKSQLFLLECDIAKTEKRLAIAHAEYKDTEKLETRLAGMRRLEKIIHMEMNEENEKTK
jgi:hypothetical protein